MLIHPRNISFPMLVAILDNDPKMDFGRDTHAVTYKLKETRFRIRNSTGLLTAIRALHDRSGVIDLSYRPLKQSELDEIAARKKAEEDREAAQSGSVPGEPVV
jgi:hypothetical protein